MAIDNPTRADLPKLRRRVLADWRLYGYLLGAVCSVVSIALTLGGAR